MTVEEKTRAANMLISAQRNIDAHSQMAEAFRQKAVEIDNECREAQGKQDKAKAGDLELLNELAEEGGHLPFDTSPEGIAQEMERIQKERAEEAST